MPEEGWIRPALLLVAALTLMRILSLALSPTDLFVDESQYWLWGQSLDFGYYSKPPLIAWVIRLSTAIGGDTAFWVRLPAPLFHAATALILGALAARLWSAREALAVALAYATLPMTAWGSFLISTDTIMAPFFALALLAWFRAIDEGRVDLALGTGLAIGVAFLAKYAAVYFILGVVLAAVRSRWRPTAAQVVALGAGVTVVILPNVIWNLTHGLVTVEHTMDNASWVRGLSGLHPDRLAEFLLAQFGVFGPVLLVALVWQYLRPAGEAERRLRPFSLPPLVLVSGQALLARAYANWAVAAYFAGTLVAVPALRRRAPRLFGLSMAINLALCLAVLVAVARAEDFRLGRDRPVLDRYLGRADLSRLVLAQAKSSGAMGVYAVSRDLLADLHFTGAGAGIPVFAPNAEGRPANYYEQTWPLPPVIDGPVLAVVPVPPICNGAALAPVADLAGSGAYAGETFAAYLVQPGCRDALR